MPSLTPSLNNLENSVGIYKLAISFSSDAEDEARVIFDFCKFYDVSCYWYHSNAIWQSGLDIFECMRFAYSKSSNVVIINSPLYRKSAATQFEFDIIMRRHGQGRLDILSLGGADIVIAGNNIFHSSFTAESLITMLLDIRG